MPDAFTPNLALIKPEIGASRDTWGAKLNANTDVIDDVLAMAMPIGAILDFAGPNAPPGWLICDGRLVSRVTYSALFGRIGTYWGAGDGSTNFALPPTTGRVSVGAGNLVDAGGTGAYSFGLLFGQQMRSITQANLPNYPISTDPQGLHNHGSPGAAPSGAHGHTTDPQGQHNHAGSTTGENVDHTHSGWTDPQGQHTHLVNAWAAFGGGGLQVGGVATQGGLATDPAGSHSHNVGTYGASQAHSHGIYMDGSHAHNVYGVGDHQHWLYWDGSHAHTVWLGGGGALLDIRQPLMVVTKIIFAGQQASTRVLTAAAAAPTRRLSAPLRGSH